MSQHGHPDPDVPDLELPGGFRLGQLRRGLIRGAVLGVVLGLVGWAAGYRFAGLTLSAVVIPMTFAELGFALRGRRWASVAGTTAVAYAVVGLALVVVSAQARFFAHAGGVISPSEAIALAWGDLTDLSQGRFWRVLVFWLYGTHAVASVFVGRARIIPNIDDTGFAGRTLVPSLVLALPNAGIMALLAVLSCDDWVEAAAALVGIMTLGSLGLVLLGGALTAFLGVLVALADRLDHRLGGQDPIPERPLLEP